MDYAVKTIQTELGEISLQLCDTFGDETDRPLIAVFIKEAHCIILGYDVTRRHSFDSIKDSWYNFVKEKTEKIMY